MMLSCLDILPEYPVQVTVSQIVPLFLNQFFFKGGGQENDGRGLARSFQRDFPKSKAQGMMHGLKGSKKEGGDTEGIKEEGERMNGQLRRKRKRLELMIRRTRQNWQRRPNLNHVKKFCNFSWLRDAIAQRWRLQLHINPASMNPTLTQL